jgi:hypothetical protein
MLYSPNDLEAPNLSQSADVLLTRDEMKNTLADTLNGNINLLNDEYKDSMLAVAKKFGVSLSDLCSWKKGDPTPTLTHS